MSVSRISDAQPTSRPEGAPRQARRVRLDAASIIARQHRMFGGAKIGVAFFGWVTAVGMTVILTLAVLTLMFLVSIVTDTSAEEATEDAAANTAAVSVLGAILLAVIVTGAFLCGGFVAARMSRFDGLLQGLAVWAWTVAVPLALLVIALVLDLGFRDMALSLLPNLAAAVLLFGLFGVALVGSVVGGLLGEHYHRVVDDVGLHPVLAEEDGGRPA